MTKKLSGQLELFKDPIKHRAIIPNLRFRLLCWAAKLVRHAGQTALKLSQSYAHF